MAMLKKIGSLWVAKDGQKAVLSGVIELLGQDIRVGVFKNAKVEGNQPPYAILRYPENNDMQAATPDEGDMSF